jgi:hypothetical protein
VAGGRLGKNHIRQIRHFYLSSRGEARQEPAVAAPCLIVNVSGTPGSPWTLALAVNLALAAAMAGEETRLTLPPPLLAAGARLLGGAAGQLGQILGESDPGHRRRLHPQLSVGSPTECLFHQKPVSWQWHFELHPKGGSGGTWLYLLDAEGLGGFLDPRGGSDEALFLVGFEVSPRPLRAANGVWGALRREDLLHAEGLPRAAYLRASSAERDRFAGWLESLKRIVRPRGAKVGAGS